MPNALAVLKLIASSVLVVCGGRPTWVPRTLGHVSSLTSGRCGRCARPASARTRPVLEAVLEEPRDGGLCFRPSEATWGSKPSGRLRQARPRAHCGLLGQLDRPSLVGRDPVLQIIHEAVELGVRDRAVHPAVALCGVAVEVVGTDDNLECSRTAHKRGQPLARTAARHDACANFELRPLELAQSRTIHLHLGADVVSLRRAGHLRCRA